jgi:hypothetical protein
MTANWDLPLPDFDSAAYQWAADNAELMGDRVRETINVKTGGTQGTIESEGVADAILVTGDKVAGYLQTGTEAHPIDALGPYSLHNPETGEYFGRHVEHPGTGPYPFVEDAIDATQVELEMALADKLTEGWAG